MSRRPVPLFRHLVVCVIVLGSAGVARADLLDEVIKYTEPQLAPAKPLIECLAGGGDAVACAKEVAEKQATSQLPYQPADPTVKKIVSAFEAARDERWVDFLGLVGEVAASKVTCAMVPLAGPVKSAACQIIEYAIAKNGQLLGKTYQAVMGPDWWALFKIVGTGVCQFIPADGDAGYAKDVLCGALGQVLIVAQQFASMFASGMTAVSDTLEKAIFGDDSHMPFDTYYALYHQPWYHHAVDRHLQGLNNDWFSTVTNQCVDYFDSHDQYRSTAKKTCGNFQSKFFSQVKGFTAAMPVAVTGYFESTARPAIKTAVLASYGKPSTAGGPLPGQAFFEQNCAFTIGAKFPFPEPNEGRCMLIEKHASKYPMLKPSFLVLAKSCYAAVKQQLPSPTAYQRVCTAVGPKYQKAFAQESMSLLGAISRLEAKGCTLASKAEAAKSGLSITCPTYTTYNACLSELAPNDGRKYCHVAIQQVARKPAGGETARAGQPQFSGLVNVEAEALLDARKATASAGQLGARDGKLVWDARAGGTLDLTIDIATAATYAVELYLARGPEHARASFEIDGKPVLATFEGYSPRAAEATPLQAGKFSMAAGAHTLRIKHTGAYRDSKGTVIAIDRVRLYWAGNP